MKRTLVAAALMILSAALLGVSAGEQAPDFSAINQDGKTVHLADFRGKPVLLYFYPADDTPGCTKEACHFRDEFKTFRDMGAIILGVSRQGPKSHRAFRAKYHLPFDLLSDPKGELAKSYGVGQMPIVGYLKRESVLISPSGKVIHFYQDVNPATHSADVLKDLEDYAVRAGKNS